MATLTTKYDMGQRVWHASTTSETFMHDCPDCLGSKEWIATSPAGGEFKVPCPRCSTNYRSSSDLNLRYAKFVPTAHALTIGQIKASTEVGDGFDRGNTYMCHETGIGSGNYYYEADLFETEAEALEAAQAKANATNENPDFWVAKQYDKTAEFSDYQLKDAEIEAAKSRSSQYGYRIQYLVEDLKEAESVAEVARIIAAWEEKKDSDQ